MKHWYTKLLLCLLVMSLGSSVSLAKSQRKARKPAQNETKQSSSQNAKLERQIEQARVLEKKGDRAGVIAILQPHSSVLPQEGLLLLARAYKQNKDHITEARTLELALAKNAKDYRVLTNLGESYAALGRNDDAITKFREARQINQKYLPAYEGLTRTLEKVGMTYEARIVVNDMIKSFGKKPRFATLLCHLYSVDNFLEKSVEVCQDAVKRDPKTPENYVYLGASLRDLEEPKKAEKILLAAARNFPKSELVLSTLGDFYMRNKNYTSAHSIYRKSVLADHQSARALLGYANASFELQKNTEALEAFVKACQLNRDHGKAIRIALTKLKERKDTKWQAKFEDGLSNCH